MLDAISSVVSAVAAQSVTAKDEAQTKNTNTASKKQDAKTDKSDAKTAGFSEEAAVYEKSDSKDDSKDTAKSTVNQKMSKADRDALVQALKDDAKYFFHFHSVVTEIFDSFVYIFQFVHKYIDALFTLQIYDFWII